ncbi:MAG: DUF222 domain-containing protein, partial [Nocardioidaceae bacterium]|nr:DUF222 domain-containing protein [Nocardioidaceae bacterium]
AETGATSTTAWLAHATRCTRAAARSDVRLAHALEEERHAVTRTALAAGDLTLDQARVVVGSLHALPDDAPPWVRPEAQKRLVELAALHAPPALRLLGRRVYEVVDPEAADRDEGRRLEAQEAAAARATYLQLQDNHDGTHSLRARLPDLHAAMLTKALHALDQPRLRPDGPTPTRPERLGRAFCDLLERLPADRLPKAGGSSATVVVLLDYDKLVSGVGAARLDTGTRISAGEARRLVCSAGIVPVVFRRAVDGRSVVLDAGRRRRLFSRTQRLLLTVQDQGCVAEGCDRPASWCEADHMTAWQEGGRTDLANGRLLCGFHHRKAHSQLYVSDRLPDGKVRFHRRT